MAQGPKTPSEGQHSEEKKNEQREKDLIEQIPDEIDENAERGERMGTGKTIAEGGQPASGQSQS